MGHISANRTWFLWVLLTEVMVKPRLASQDGGSEESSKDKGQEHPRKVVQHAQGLSQARKQPSRREVDRLSLEVAVIWEEGRSQRFR